MSMTFGLLTSDLCLDPLAASRAALPIIAPLFETLLRRDRIDDELSPALAQAFDVSPDGTLCRFRLRQSLFHDGQPVRASDVARSLSRHLQSGAPSILGPTLQGLLHRGGSLRDDGIAESLQVDDPAGLLTVRLAAPYAPMAELLSHTSLGIVRELPDGRVIGSGPLCAQGLHEGRVRCRPRFDGAARPGFQVKTYPSAPALRHAIDSGEIDAASVERRHYGVFDGCASTELRERWVGALMLNAAGALRSVEARLDLRALCQSMARQSMGERFQPMLLPPGLATPCYYDCIPSSLDARTFAQRWRKHLRAEPLRIVLAPGRGPLTHIVELLVDALQGQQLEVQVLEVAEPAGVYELVARGAFDVVGRGWAEDYADAEEYFGIFEKQAPGALAQRHVSRFITESLEARHLASPVQRRAVQTAALLRLEHEGLCIPICGEHNRVFHRPELALPARSRDLFSLPATAGASFA